MNDSNKYQHQPVLLAEVLTALAIKSDGIYFDATYGRGGYSRKILEHLGPEGRLIGIDKDPEAVKVSQETPDQRIEVIHGSYATLVDIAKKQKMMGRVNGIVFDLGVSSPQLEDPIRGFSFVHDGPLDMRMDNTRGITAAKWLVTAKESEISKVLHDFGEERYARRIAQAIVQERAENQLTTTGQLAEIVKRANPGWEKGKHPATRTFQAIRIFINNELIELETALQQALEVMTEGGRLVVVSFHSLEDRIVKQFIRHHSSGETIPRGIPMLAKNLPQPRLKAIGSVIRPSHDEVVLNPRSRSAIMRVCEKKY